MLSYFYINILMIKPQHTKLLTLGVACFVVQATVRLRAYKPIHTQSPKLFLLSSLRQRSMQSILVQLECCSPTHLWILQAFSHKAPWLVHPLRILQPPIRHYPLSQ